MQPELSNLTSCRLAWSTFFAKHGLPETAIAFSDGTPIFAFSDGTPIFAWCLHHEVLAEPLFDPIENRISYILSNKRKDQHDLRFLNLRPVSRENTEAVATAFAEYLKVRDAAWDEYEKAMAPALDEFEKATASGLAAYKKATEEFYGYVATARAALSEALAPFHLADVPNHTWNGRSIFA